MYACLHQPLPAEDAGTRLELLELALEFSPLVELAAPATVVFSIVPLRRKFGSPRQIACLLARRQKEQGLHAQLAIAPNPDTAILLAQHASAQHSGEGIVADPGTEALHLAALPLAVLLPKDRPAFSAMLPLLESWGLETCGDLARLPESGIVERLGTVGLTLRRLAAGQVRRPLRVRPLESPYEEHRELEHALDCLEPLLFLVSAVLSTFCERLRSQGRAARRLELELSLENKQSCCRSLEFPVPLEHNRAMLKLLQLELDRHPAPAAVMAFTLRIQPSAPRVAQHGLFLPPTPAPDKLHLTLARIAGIVGTANVGTPELLNTHRSDAFRLVAPAEEEARQERVDDHPGSQLHLTLRLFRPALPAQVRLRKEIPEHVIASAVEGNVLRASGPWKTSGEWWSATGWTHEEWDIAVENGAAYCLIYQRRARQWFLQGIYD